MLDLNDRDSIINSFMNESGSFGFHTEDPENDLLLAEALFQSELTGEELADLTENTSEMGALIQNGILSERSIVKFDKKAKLSRLEAQAVLIIAKEKKDRDFNKLIRVWKMRKFLLDKLNKRYASQAKARARQMLSKTNSMKSQSTAAKKVVSRQAKKL